LPRVLSIMHHRLLFRISPRLKLYPLPLFLRNLLVVEEQECRKALDDGSSVIWLATHWVV